MQVTPTSVSVDVEVERNNTHVQAKTLRPVQKEVTRKGGRKGGREGGREGREGGRGGREGEREEFPAHRATYLRRYTTLPPLCNSYN